MAVISWTGRFSLLALLLVDITSAARQDQTKSQLKSHAASLDENEAGSVPAVINNVLKSARRIKKDQLKELQEAEKAAEVKKAAKTSAVETKKKLVEDVDSKVKAVEAKSIANREAMVTVEKAATAHMASGQTHKDAVDKWNQISKEVEDLDGQIGDKNKAMMEALKKMKDEIEALKDQRDQKVKDRNAADEKQQELKGKLMAANKFKAGVEQEQAKAEKAVQDAQQELQDVQGQLESARSAAQAAEGEETEASDKLREAKAKTERVSRSLELIEKVKKAAQAMYKSVDALDENMSDDEGPGEPWERIKSNPLLKTLFQNYQEMANAFIEVHGFDNEIYMKLKPATVEIDRNTVAAIHYACDPYGKLGKSEDNNSKVHSACCKDLWDAVGLTRITFPN